MTYEEVMQFAGCKVKIYCYADPVNCYNTGWFVYHGLDYCFWVQDNNFDIPIGMCQTLQLFEIRSIQQTDAPLSIHYPNLSTCFPQVPDKEEGIYK